MEVYYHIGLKKEAQKYAKVLGYNYESSKWYENTYAVFNKRYIVKNNKNTGKIEKKSSLIKKMKSLFDFDE